MRNIHWVASHHPHDPRWEPGLQPRHVPWLGINWRPFILQATTQSTEPHLPGQCLFWMSVSLPDTLFMHYPPPHHDFSPVFSVLFCVPECWPRYYIPGLLKQLNSCGQTLWGYWWGEGEKGQSIALHPQFLPSFRTKSLAVSIALHTSVSVVRVLFHCYTSHWPLFFFNILSTLGI